MVKLSDFMNMIIVSQPTLYMNLHMVLRHICWKKWYIVYTWTVMKLDLFSIDIYTCKDYELEKIIDFTKKVFENNHILLGENKKHNLYFYVF